MIFSDPVPTRNLFRIQEDQSLWRVFPDNRGLELFQHRRNVLVTPSKWEDPFENFLARCKVRIDDHTLASLGGLTDGFVGQCWTDEEKETDATWRIYAPANQRGMRIRVRTRKLFDTIYDSAQPLSEISCFIGKIRYVTESGLRKWLESLSVSGDLLDPTGIAIAQTLLIKRAEFAHEAEVRLLFQEPSAANRGQTFRAFACDPNALVEHVLLDPRWSQAEAATAERQLRCFGYTGVIEHSRLYWDPTFETLTL